MRRMTNVNITIRFKAENGYSSRSEYSASTSTDPMASPETAIINAARELARLSHISGVGNKLLEAVQDQIASMNKD